MIDQVRYYFEALPLHPQPEKLESLTSYLTRLAEANGIQTSSAFAHICFPEYNIEAIHSLNDFPLYSLMNLQAAACCSEAVVQATTFYHLGRKFGRVYDSRACYHFLRNSIAPFFRYCPLCIKERGYYSLLWRFLFVKGCSDHACNLLDTCGHCGEKILIFTSPLQFGLCPSCGRNLGLCRIQPLIEAEEDTLSYSQDLLFLLSPQPWESMTSTLAQHVGEQFALLRQSKELTVQEMAERAGLPPRKIKGVEFDIIDTYTTPFQSYLQCAKYLGVSLHNIFDAVLERRRFHGLPQTDQIQRSENESITKMQKAIKILIECKMPITKNAVCRIAQLSNAELLQSPSLGIQLQQLVPVGCAEQRQQVILEKNAIQDKVSEMIKQLEHSGKPVTYQSISTLISVASVSSSENWQMIRFINQYISQYLYDQHNIVQEEDRLVVRTEIAINQLKELGAVLTRRAIAAIVGRYQEDLQQYPFIEVLWKDFPET